MGEKRFPNEFHFARVLYSNIYLFIVQCCAYLITSTLRRFLVLAFARPNGVEDSRSRSQAAALASAGIAGDKNDRNKELPPFDTLSARA